MNFKTAGSRSKALINTMAMEGSQSLPAVESGDWLRLIEAWKICSPCHEQDQEDEGLPEG